MMLNRWQSSCAISGPPCFSTSGVMLSIPGALLFLSVLIAFKTSVILISSVLTSSGCKTLYQSSGMRVGLVGLVPL